MDKPEGTGLKSCEKKGSKFLEVILKKRDLNILINPS